MNGTDILIRHAAPQDSKDVLQLCRLLDPGDYVVRAWPLWIKMKGAINLVAEVGGRVVGCWHAEPLTSQEAWSQGTRVHPERQGRGIGTSLLRFLESELRQKGFRVIRGSIAPTNQASLALVRKFNWHVVARICRREAAGRSFGFLQLPFASLEEAVLLSREWPVLASRSHLAHFRRAYFSMTEAHLKKLTANKAVLLSSDRRAFAILDQESGTAGRQVWVVALAGEDAEIKDILWALIAQAREGAASVLVDSSEEQPVQARLNELGFKPAAPDGKYVIVERRLEL